MSEVGYTVVEPPSLDDWLCKVKNQAMLLALLTWVQQRLSQLLVDEFPLLQVEVIKVQYISTYAALGIRGEFADDLPDRINTLTEHILSSSSVNDFLNFVLDDQIDWAAKARSLLTS